MKTIQSLLMLYFIQAVALKFGKTDNKPPMVQV